MLIDKTKCGNCGQCIPYCPMACIQKKDGIVQKEPASFAASFPIPSSPIRRPVSRDAAPRK